MEITLDSIRSAAHRIAPHVLRTPLVQAWDISSKGSLFVKPETLQVTGSMKVRGAMNALLMLNQSARDRGVITASSGNHGPALAWAARQLGTRCTVCLSSLVPTNKIANVERWGGTVRIEGGCYDEASEAAVRLSEQEGMTLVPGFDHPDIIAGAGTSGLEIIEDLPEADTILAPLSGGGLLAGIAIAVKSISPRTRVIGVSMERGASMHESLKVGRPVNVAEEDSLADALGGSIGLNNQWTFPAVAKFVDETVLVSEEMIAEAMRRMFRNAGLVVEGAGAVGLAAFLQHGRDIAAGRTVIVASGRNVDMDRFVELMSVRMSN